MHLVIDKNHLVNFSPSGNCNLSTHNTMIKKKIKIYISVEFNFRAFSFAQDLNLPIFVMETLQLFH